MLLFDIGTILFVSGLTILLIFLISPPKKNFDSTQRLGCFSLLIILSSNRRYCDDNSTLFCCGYT